MQKKDYLSEIQFDINVQGASNGLLITHPDVVSNRAIMVSTIATTKKQALEVISKQLDEFYKD